MSDEAQVGGSIVMDVAEWLCVFAVVGGRFVRGTDRYRAWCDLDAREAEWASRALQREFGVSGLWHRGIRRAEI
jgi:hypothetical protein